MQIYFWDLTGAGLAWGTEAIMGSTAKGTDPAWCIVCVGVTKVWKGVNG